MPGTVSVHGRTNTPLRNIAFGVEAKRRPIRVDEEGDDEIDKEETQGRKSELTQ